MSLPKFDIGDKVKVNHPTCGKWSGEVTYRSQTGTGDGVQYRSQWKVEVERERNRLLSFNWN